MAETDLQSIKIETVCQMVDISKVTFFKYFSSKEEVLQHYIVGWQYKMTYELHRDGIKGKEAIYHILDSISEHPAGKHIMYGIIHHFVKQDDFSLIQLSDYELYSSLPEAYAVGIRVKDICELFKDALETYGFDEELETRLLKELVTGFYGVPIRGKVLGELSLTKAYHDFVDTLLDGYI